MALAERIKKVLEDNELSITSYCEKSGTPYHSFQKTANGKRVLRYEDLEVFAEYFGDVDMNWLIRGKHIPSSDIVMEESAPYETASKEELIDEAINILALIKEAK